ncbi:MAG: hypothetical protein CMIDDMOC_00360 [Sodalis sp. Fle]|nr:MAG: hypothetical protein CMIDDMOC_00360 [Sodalis sp. Fle]
MLDMLLAADRCSRLDTFECIQAGILAKGVTYNSLRD